MPLKNILLRESCESGMVRPEVYSMKKDILSLALFDNHEQLLHPAGGSNLIATLPSLGVVEERKRHGSPDHIPLPMLIAATHQGSSSCHEQKTSIPC